MNSDVVEASQSQESIDSFPNASMDAIVSPSSSDAEELTLSQRVPQPARRPLPLSSKVPATRRREPPPLQMQTTRQSGPGALTQEQAAYRSQSFELHGTTTSTSRNKGKQRKR
jgi:hypothetical protein